MLRVFNTNTNTDTNTMSNHSTIVGGSTAGRVLACPGSWQATMALPPSADVASQYAEEGSFAHEVMAYMMGGAAGPSVALAQALVGMHFYDRVLTQAHLDEMILPALHAFWALLAEYDITLDSDKWPYQTIEIEKGVTFPDIPGAFGTCDVLLRVADHVFLVDWKFGAGVPVKAVYRDPEGDLVNPQLLFYATAAMNSAKPLFKGAKVLVAAIIQPRAEDPISHTTVTRRDIKWFREDLQQAVVTAVGRNPPRAKGEHCRWAPCKVNCPLWTGPILELVAMSSESLDRTEPVSRETTPYANYLAKAKALVDIAAMYKKEVDEQLHAYLEDGGSVPGWRLKAKTKQRQWVDEDIVQSELTDLGFTLLEIYQKKLVSFQSADATAKRLGVKIPDALRVAPPTTETTVCPTDDPAPVVDRQLAIEQFRASLAELSGAKALPPATEPVSTRKGKRT